MIKYLRRTWKNKAVALALVAVGYFSAIVDGTDGGGLVYMLFFAIPLFFARRNIID